MNICMLAYAHYINDARIKNYVRTLEDNGHRVDVIALRSNGESREDKRPSGTISRIMDKYQGDSALMYAWSYLRFFVKSFILLSCRMFGSRYDVIHVHNMPNALVFATIVPKLFGARVMLDVHDLMTVNFMAKFGVKESSLPVRTLRWEQQISALMADHLFCADHNQREYLAEECRIPRNKMTVLLNLPNTDIFQPVDVQKVSDRFRIVYHGTIAHRLGIDLIVQALAKAIAQGVPAELWVYGAGDFLSDVRALAVRLGIEEWAHFSGSFFPVEKIPEMVCGMDMGIIGNRRNLACAKYMLPVKLLEYVYLGIPVAAPKLEVIQYYFDESMVCFYEPEDIDQMARAIVELYRSREKRERQAKAACAFYVKYNPDLQARVYLAVMAQAGHDRTGHTVRPA